MCVFQIRNRLPVLSDVLLRWLRASLLQCMLMALAVSAVDAVPVIWTDWVSGTPGATGSAEGVISTGTGDITVNYAGEIAFLQTSGGTNYWIPSGPYVSEIVDNAPLSSDIIALSSTTQKTLTFSEPIDNLFFAVVSLNGNGYVFDSDFEVVSFGPGFWGSGTLERVDLGNGQFVTTGSGEPHGVIRFNQAVSSISWTSQTPEFWNGFTVGTFGSATAIPEPSTTFFLLLGAVLLGIRSCKLHRRSPRFRSACL